MNPILPLKHFVPDEGLMVALIWYAVLIPAAWGAFRRCELK